MIKLKLIVSEPRAFAGVDFEHNQSLIDEAIKQGNKVSTMAGAYLHGDVESAMGYDICACLNIQNCVKDNKYITGKFPVEVIGYDNPCVAFLWNDEYNNPRGLIVDKNDKKSYNYAVKEYNNKSSRL